MLIAALCISTQSLTQSAYARTLSEAEIIQTIHVAKIFKTPNFRATFSDGTVIVNMYRNPSAPERDLKIDAVLVTKALRDRYPADVKAVSMNFYDQTNRTAVRQCTVPEQMIKRFASGGITQEDLLSFLTVTKGAAVVATGSRGGGGSTRVDKEVVRAYKIQDGFNYNKRSTLYNSIREVAFNGYNIDTIWYEFMKLESEIKANHQEETIEQFNKVNRLVDTAIPIVNEANAKNAQSNMIAKANAATEEAMAKVQPAYGFAFPRRCAIWGALMAKRKTADVSYYVQNFVERVEPLARRGDSKEAREAIMSLEKSLGLNYSQPF